MRARPLYETTESLSEERLVAERIGEAWSCNPVKLARAYQLDFALCRDDAVQAWAEVKVRTKRYPTYMLSLHKWLAAVELHERTGLPALLVVQWPDLLAYCALSGLRRPLSVTMGGRRDRGDWQDMEPVVHIPLEFFNRVRVAR